MSFSRIPSKQIVRRKEKKKMKNPKNSQKIKIIIFEITTLSNFEASAYGSNKLKKHKEIVWDKQ